MAAAGRESGFRVWGSELRVQGLGSEHTPAHTSSESQGGRGVAAYWNSLSWVKAARIANICPTQIMHQPQNRCLERKPA
jgi:hypothetical protein